MKTSIVYFIQIRQNGPIKIGITNNLVKRFGAIQTTNPEDLFLIGAIEATKKDETTLHYKFSDYKIKGEWFLPSDELIAYISNLNPEIVISFNTARLGNCVDCNKKNHDISQLNYYTFIGLCRRCCMKRDGRLEKFTELGKRSKPITPITQCSNCNNFFKPLRKGRCHACAEYFRRNNVERPLIKEPRICKICEEKEPQYMHDGRCSKCYIYFRRHSAERPTDLQNRICMICNSRCEPGRFITKRCSKCYIYKLRNKVDKQTPFVAS